MIPDPKEFKGEKRLCKRCGNPYKLGIPYSLANSPARDLCDTCIMNLSTEELNEYLFDNPLSSLTKIISSGNKGGSPSTHHIETFLISP